LHAVHTIPTLGADNFSMIDPTTGTKNDLPLPRGRVLPGVGDARLDRVSHSLHQVHKNRGGQSGNLLFRPRNSHHPPGSSVPGDQKERQCAVELVFFAAPKVGRDNGYLPFWRRLTADRVHTSLYV